MAKSKRAKSNRDILGQYAFDNKDGRQPLPQGIGYRGDGTLGFHSKGLFGTHEGDPIQGSFNEDLRVVTKLGEGATVLDDAAARWLARNDIGAKTWDD